MPERQCQWCGKIYPFYEDHDSVECRDALREENARLRAEGDAQNQAGLTVMRDRDTQIIALTRERDEARAKAIRFDLDQAGITQREKEAVELVELRAEVSRLKADKALYIEEFTRITAAREAAEAEVSRLEGLIRDMATLARGIKGRSVCRDGILETARRIRAQREEGR